MTARRIFGLLGVPLVALSGCATSQVDSVARPAEPRPEVAVHAAPDPKIRLVSEDVKPEPAPASPCPARPAYGALETFPIDLPTVVRLVDETSPAVAIAQARVRQAQALQDRAEVQWLPNLSVGVAYNRFDGQTQNQRGEVFDVSRANLFTGGGPALLLDTADAYFAPLVTRRLTSAELQRNRAVVNRTELEAVTAYLDLVQVHAQLAINADTLTLAEAMLTAAQNAKDARLDRTPGDVNRAKTEVLLRRVERIELEGRVGVLSARLGRLLLLPPSVRLVPAETAVVPVLLIDPKATLDDLVGTAIRNRPELAADRELVAAAWASVRRQEVGMLLPKLAVANQSGTFGGGTNDDLQNFDGRNALGAQIYWEIKNLGFGNRAEIAERRAALDQTRFQQVEDQARIVAEIVELAQTAAARYESLDLAERAVKEATELYRINKEGTLNVVDSKNLFDALRPLQAIQVLNQSRTNYLAAVVELNRAQYRLFTAIGRSPAEAVPGQPVPTSGPAVP